MKKSHKAFAAAAAGALVLTAGATAAANAGTGPAAAAVPASTVFAYPWGFKSPVHAIAVLTVVIVPALLMVSTIRFRSFKTFDLGARRSYPVLILIALALAVLAAQPELLLAVVAYTYLVSGIVAWMWGRFHRRAADEQGSQAAPHSVDTSPASDAPRSKEL